MYMIFSIALPVIAAVLVGAIIYRFLKIFFQGKREEYKIISIAASFLIGIFAGMVAMSFLD